MPRDVDDLPSKVDLLVLGAGAGGMTAALTAAILGMDVLLVEKTDQVGGTTARSAGSIWVPNSHHSPPGEDRNDRALTYLRNAVGNRLDFDRAAAFLRAGPEMVAFLEEKTPVRLRAYAYHPDYLATLAGATLRGRVFEPEPFDARVLGLRFADLRPPLPEFMLLGGMMVDRTDIGHLMSETCSLLRPCAPPACPLWPRPDEPHKGHAAGHGQCVGRAPLPRPCSAPVALSTRVEALLTEGGCVTGARLRRERSAVEVHTRAGVVLATGGLSNDPALRHRLFPRTLDRASAVVRARQATV